MPTHDFGTNFKLEQNRNQKSDCSATSYKWIMQQSSCNVSLGFRSRESLAIRSACSESAQGLAKMFGWLVLKASLILFLDKTAEGKDDWSTVWNILRISIIKMENDNKRALRTSSYMSKLVNYNLGWENSFPVSVASRPTMRPTKQTAEAAAEHKQ